MRKRTVLLVVLIVVGVACVLGTIGYAFFYCFTGGRQAMRIVSRSMVPALNPGDVILVEPVAGIGDVVVGYTTGDIICFHKPGNPDELIIHRAVEKVTDGLKTKGDNNNSVDFWTITEDMLVGKVVEVNSLPLQIARTFFNVPEVPSS